MKMLFTHRPGGAYGVISESWINAAKDMGIETARLDEKTGQDADAAHNAFKGFKPDVYVGCSGHRQCIPLQRDRAGGKIAIHVNPMPVSGNSTVDEPQNTIQWTLWQKPDVVFGYGFEHDAQWWAGWTKNHGLPFVPMATAGDITLYKPDYGVAGSIPSVYVGGYWPYKAKSIDKYLLPIAGRVKLDLYGWGSWPIKSQSIADGEIPSALARAKVGPCISEPHTHSVGIDLPERVFKVILSGAIPVHDPALNVRLALPSIPVATDPASYGALCEQYIAMDEQARRRISIRLITELIERGHTYHHRVANLLAKLGFGEYVHKAKERCDAFLRDVKSSYRS